MMHCGKKILQSLTPRSMHTQKITQCSKSKGFIKYHPIFYFISISTSTDIRIFAKPVNNLPVCPAALIFKGLWKIPMIQSNPWLYIVFKALINYTMIKIYSSPVNAAGSTRSNTGPRQRKSECPEIQLFNNIYIFRETV